MIEQGGGSIINVSSGNALFGSPSISSYESSQGGDDQFHTKSGGHLRSLRGFAPTR